MPQIQLLDGKKISFTKSINGFDLTKKISKSLEKAALIMEVDGQLKDLSHEITKNYKVRIITSKYKEGLEFGERIEYNLEGQLKRKFIVNNSIKDGYYIEYDKNDSSKILQEGEYKNNKLDGEWKVYKSEQIVISKMYVDDKLDGNWLEFYSDGKKKLISKYKNNKLHGEYIKFNEFDKISEKSLYKNGKLSGDFSINVTFFAPLDIASKPKAPVPAKISRTLKSSKGRFFFFSLICK